MQLKPGLWCFCWMLLLSLCSALDVIIDGNKTAKAGSDVSLKCDYREKYDICEWLHNSLSYEFDDIKDNIYSELRTAENLNNNKCGIVIKNATKAFASGEWTCRFTVSRTNFPSGSLFLTMNDGGIPSKVNAGAAVNLLLMGAVSLLFLTC